MVTIKIDERTKAGKAFLEIAKIFSREKKGVEIVKPALVKKAKSKSYPVSKNVPNAETLKAMEEAEKGIGVKRFDSVDALFEDLGI
ncbi:type II toxin-antitoxin system RelB/DinJ family antitoxin [Zunongwangia sp. F363]|uniref:Type II toxin-antitoxin system RelB/DinJ family antitoxin n=1 Tax=Autumnicola tepida TaxID=3075595 RepID=A0ABU3CBJ1_9FLAO|nr:type II toxin-antitoxin system RelB/DinJ family antitoxin [Zunongwangia sp. F363]MDT0643700.1 type II toxin-antitoxin system RelB/DinJ family antitoxin [Zunongwangia sp. F363]